MSVFANLSLISLGEALPFIPFYFIKHKFFDTFAHRKANIFEKNKGEEFSILCGC